MVPTRTKAQVVSLTCSSLKPLMMVIYVSLTANPWVYTLMPRTTYVQAVTLLASLASDKMLDLALNALKVSFKLTNTLVIHNVSQKTHSQSKEINANVNYFIVFIDLACVSECKSCFGYANDECTDCYPPYYLDKEDTTCLYNETWAAIIDAKYTPVSNIL